MTAVDQKILQAVVSGKLTAAQRKAILGIVSASASPEALPLLLTQAQAARVLQCSRFTIRRLVREGRIRPILLTPDLARYRAEEIQALAAGTTAHEQ